MTPALPARLDALVRTVILGLCALTVACGPTAGPSAAAVQQELRPIGGGAAGDMAPTAPVDLSSASKTLVIGLAAEVKGFSEMNGNQNKYVEDLVVGNLFLNDEQGLWRPALAAETPQLGTDTWKLLDDGSSEVIYRLKPGVKWHDGAPFTVDDLIFFYTVASDPELPYARHPKGITKLEALDDLTLRVTRNYYEVQSDHIDLRQMWPMPRHLLEADYNRGDKLAFVNHPYWTTEFVGLGPYKLTRFEPGTYLELAAYDDYVLGKPPIGKVVVQFYQDTNVLITALLAGSVHMTLQGAARDGALSMNEGIALAAEWAKSGEGRVIFNPNRINALAVQWNKEFQQPAALGDLRVRRALLHAVDRATLAGERFGGVTQVAEGWVPAGAPDADSLADAITHYPYDPSLAQQLLADAGWQKDADGMLIDAAGRPLELEYRFQGKDAELTATAVADYWKQIGVDTQLLVIPSVRARDNEWMAKFPGVRSDQHVAAPVGGGINGFDCANAPSETNRWIPQSQNPGGYCDSEMQAQVVAFGRAFPYAATLVPFKEMTRIALRDLPYLPLYFESEAVAVRSNVRGLNAISPQILGRSAMWVYTWTMS